MGCKSYHRISNSSSESYFLHWHGLQILSQNFKFILRVVFSCYLLIILSCALIWSDLAVSAVANASIHVSWSLYNHLKERSKGLFQHLLLHANAEIVKLLLSSANEGQRQGGVKLSYADPTRPWTMIRRIFLLMNLSLLNLLWSGRLGDVRIQEDKLILDVSKEVQGVVGTSTNDSQ